MACRLCSEGVLQRLSSSLKPAPRIHSISRSASSKPASNDADRDTSQSLIKEDQERTSAQGTPADPEHQSGKGYGADLDTNDDVEGEAEAREAAARGGRGRKFPSAETWLKTDGSKFKRPMEGRVNWIGKVPFPLNESFRPPPPVSNAMKSSIYNAFVTNLQKAKAGFTSSSSSTSSSDPVPTSESYHVRQLSLKYNLSIDRIRAIIRLKALEANSNPAFLQYKFSNAMESYLGVARSQTAPIPLMQAGLNTTQAEVERVIEQDFSTGHRANYVMTDEENKSELAEIEDEARQRASRRASIHKNFVNPQQSLLDYKEDRESDVRSKKHKPANPDSRRKKGRPQIQFVDVPSQRSARGEAQASGKQ